MNISTHVAVTFENQFGRKPLMLVAPGRINLIGEHTDYNEGFVMPAAIDKHFVFAVASNQTKVFNLNAVDLHETVSFTQEELKSGSHWHNYLMGVIDGFVRRGKKIEGIDCAFSSNIPAGAGLSSSAALCSGFGYALNEIFNCWLSKLDLALIAQEAEHQYAGTKCGIMDMYASLFSSEDSVMLLDCRSNQHEPLPAHFDGYELLLIDTKVKHSLNESGYNDRRAACEAGVKAVQMKHPQVKALRDVSMEMLEESRQQMGEVVYKKCSYIVREIDRTQRAGALLKKDDLVGFGKLMYETHWGLSKDFEISCDESDWLVEWASNNKITGARQMGGGFGGCTINLIKKELVQTISKDVREKYVAAFKKEPDFYSVKISSGVRKIKSVLDWRER